MSVFDSDGHVLLDSVDTMFAVLKELYEAEPTKWRGFVNAMQTPDNPGWLLAVNPTPDRVDRPPVEAVVGDHLYLLPQFGLLLRRSPEEYADEAGI